MNAEVEQVSHDTFVVTFNLGENVSKTDMISDTDWGISELAKTVTALESIIEAVHSNRAAEEQVETSILLRVRYEPRTEWTSGTITYAFGDIDSFTELTRTGYNEIQTGLKSWCKALNEVYDAFYETVKEEGMEVVIDKEFDKEFDKGQTVKHPDCNEIIPGLYVGSCDAVSFLVNSGIVKRVINCTKELGNMASVSDDLYLQIPLEDSGTFDDQAVLADNFKRIMKFLDRENFSDSPVLIHCQMGVSRSPSVAAAYLLHSGRCVSVPEAKRYVKEVRPVSFEGDARDTYDTALVEVYG